MISGLRQITVLNTELSSENAQPEFGWKNKTSTQTTITKVKKESPRMTEHLCTRRYRRNTQVKESHQKSVGSMVRVESREGSRKFDG